MGLVGKLRSIGVNYGLLNFMNFELVRSNSTASNSLDRYYNARAGN